MSRLATEQLATFYSKMVAEMPTNGAVPKDFQRWMADLIAGRFDIVGAILLRACGDTPAHLAVGEMMLDRHMQSLITRASMARLSDVPLKKFLRELQNRLIQSGEARLGQARELVNHAEITVTEPVRGLERLNAPQPELGSSDGKDDHSRPTRAENDYHVAGLLRKLDNACPGIDWRQIADTIGAVDWLPKEFQVSKMLQGILDGIASNKPWESLGWYPFPPKDSRRKIYKAFPGSVRKDLSAFAKRQDVKNNWVAEWVARFDVWAEIAHSRFVRNRGDSDLYERALQYVGEAVLWKATRHTRGDAATRRCEDLRVRLGQRHEFWRDLAESPQRRWSIVTSLSESSARQVRERFERLARRAMIALGLKFDHPFAAVDAWLDLLHKESPYAHDWKIKSICIASAECCAELKIRALEKGRAARVETLDELERDFGEMSKYDLHAIYRGVEDLPTEEAKSGSETLTPLQLQAASSAHADAVENQKDQIRAALKQAGRQREPVQRIEDTLRPMVPGAGNLRGRPFWLQLWAHLRKPSVYGMQKPEFMDLAPEDIFALLLSTGADALPEDGAGTDPRPARGGRRTKKLNVDTESLRNDWIGDTSLKAFARFGSISEDTLQRVLKTGKATEKTLNAITRAGRVKHLKLNVQSLTKNSPQKPQ
jgi:hypothetical protein